MPLTAKLEVLQNLDRIRRRRRDEVAIVYEARRRAVIHRNAVFAQHHAVARLAHGERAHHVDVNAVEKLTRVRAVNFDLAEC